jgi:glycosyltransferase 2 family protein
MEERTDKQEDKQKRFRQILQIFGSLISIFLFFWLLREQDWPIIWDIMKHLPVWLWFASLSLVVFGMGCNALRWYLLLRAQDVDIPILEVVRTVFAGAFASNFLPSTIGGDAFRVISLMRFTPDRVLSLTSVIVDRVMNVAATFTFLPFAWLSFGTRIFNLLGGTQVYPIAVVGIPGWDNFLDYLRRTIKRIVETFSRWRRNPISLLGAFVVSWISIFVIYFALWMVAKNLGMPVTLFQLAGVEFIVYVATLIPVSFNGLGVREVIYTTLMIELGAAPEQATALTLISRFLLLLTTTPGALWISEILNFRKK